jgi:hypothetical protein
MADNTIQLKRSSVAGKTPNTSTLATGELAINLTDKKLYSSDGSNIFEPAGNVSNINITGGIKANGSFGTNGYTLSTNGSGIYWSPAGAGSTTNTTPSNIKNIVNTSVNTIASVIDTANATGISTIEYLISARDNINSNYKSARILITTDGTTAFITEYGIVLSNNSAQVCSFDSDINAGNIRLIATGDSVDTDVSLQRVVLGSATEAGDIAASIILDSVTNTAINISAAANSVKLAYDTAIAAYSNSVSYTDTKIGTANTAMAANAAAAYTNAVAYTDSRIIDSVTNTSITHAASANSVKNAYDRAIDANTRANSAQTAATSAYSNAVSYADNKAANAYSNAVSYVDTANFTRTGITTFSANVVLGTSGISSNGSFGTDGQILASNGTATYWASTLAPRVNSATSATTLDWNSSNYEQYQLTALAANCTISADSATPVNGRKIIFRFEDNGTARSLTWTNGVSNSFRVIGTTLPTTTVANKTAYVGAIYNSTDSRWDVIAVAQEA